MPFHVHAWVEGRAAGAFDAEAETKFEALQMARWFRQQGFLVRVIGPDLEPVAVDEYPTAPEEKDDPPK